MKLFDFSAVKIILLGDSGYRIGWDQLSHQDYGLSYFWVLIESDWYKAKAKVETDRESIKTFHDKLTQLSRTEINEVVFWAGAGLYEMTLKLGNRGSISVSGSLAKSMVDSSRLPYEFESHLPAVDNFSKSIGKLLKTWNSARF
jgi:hypothetical protein